MNALVPYLCALLIVYSTHYFIVGSVSFSLIEIVFYAYSLCFLAQSFTSSARLLINNRSMILVSIISLQTILSILTRNYFFSVFGLVTVSLMITGELLSIRVLRIPSNRTVFLKILRLGTFLLVFSCFVELFLAKAGVPASILYSPYLFQRGVGLNQQFGQYSGFLREPSFLGVLISPSITLFSFQKERLFSLAIIATVVISGSSLAFLVLIFSSSIKYFAYNLSFLSKVFFKHKVKKNIVLFAVFFACCLLFVLTNVKFNQRLDSAIESQVYFFEVLQGQIDPSALIAMRGSIGKLFITFYASFQTFINTNLLGSGFGNWRYILPQALGSVDGLREISLGGSSLLIRLLGEIGVFSLFIYIFAGLYFFKDIARLHLLLFEHQLKGDYRKILMNLFTSKIWAISVIIGYCIRKDSYFDPLFIISIAILTIKIDDSRLPIENKL